MDFARVEMETKCGSWHEKRSRALLQLAMTGVVNFGGDFFWAGD